MRVQHPEALALLEIDGVPRAIVAHDAALKRGRIEVLACAPVSPGKMLLVFSGPLDEVEEAFQAAVAIAGSALVDRLLLPGVHPEVVGALRAGGDKEALDAALLVLELATATAAIRSADAGRKAAAVRIGRLHLASGFGGRAFFTLYGEQTELEAGLVAARGASEAELRDAELIARPHPELGRGLWQRPWPIDPAALFIRKKAE